MLPGESTRQLERSACRVVLGTNEHSTRLNVRQSRVVLGIEERTSIQVCTWHETFSISLGTPSTRPALHSAYPLFDTSRAWHTLCSAHPVLGISFARHVLCSAFPLLGVSFHSASTPHSASQHRSARFLHSTERSIDLERRARHADHSACSTQHAGRVLSRPSCLAIWPTREVQPTFVYK